MHAVGLRRLRRDRQLPSHSAHPLSRDPPAAGRRSPRLAPAAALLRRAASASALSSPRRRLSPAPAAHGAQSPAVPPAPPAPGASGVTVPSVSPFSDDEVMM